MIAPLMVLLAAGLAAGPVACDHPEPWEPPAMEPPAPRNGSPRQLTFNPEGDHWPVWRPDGSAIGYSFQPLERVDRDRCLGFLPPGGGTLQARICVRAGAEAESANAVSTHAVSRSGRIALVAESGDPALLFPAYRALYAGTLDDVGSLRVVRHFPYITPSGRMHLSAGAMVWPDDSTLVYMATWWSYRVATPLVPPDTEYTGIELVQLDLRGGSGSGLTVLPATLGTTSLAPGPADTVYFTMTGDSRVFWLATATGDRGTLYDFGALGIARDAQVAGGKVAAVVGGHVTAYFNPLWGIPAQADSGGRIYVARLPAGAPALLADIASGQAPVGSGTWRHLAFDRSGRRLVAERTPVVRRALPARTDTIISKSADLWLFEVPQ